MLNPIIGTVALFLSTGAAAEPADVRLDPSVPVELHGMEFPADRAVQAAAAESLSAYVLALKSRDYQAAYAMLRLSYQAANPRLDWEMKLRSRDGLWADGNIRVLRVSWYKDPADQPLGLYSAYDFRGDRTDGGMDCGYIVVHQAAKNSAFSVVRTDTSYVPAHLMKDGVPEVGVLRQLPCFLGKGIATSL